MLTRIVFEPSHVCAGMIGGYRNPANPLGGHKGASEKRVTQWLRRSESQVRRGPRFVRVGRRIFYQRHEIERYIAENTVDTRDAGRVR
jgi:hypothetical protein